MKAKSIRIRNVGGIENLEVQDVGGGLRIRGRNGAGKTSFIAALQALFSGGSRPELIRQGAEDAEIEIVLEEGNLPPLLLKRRLTANGSTIKILRRDGEKVEEVKRPQEFIASILDALSFDPVAFLTAKAEARVEALLQALPIDVDREQLQKIVGPWASALFPRGLPAGHALVVLDQIIGGPGEGLYGERTAINRVVKEAADAANRLRDTLPPAKELETDWSEKLTSLIADRDALQGAKADELRLAQSRSKTSEAPILTVYEQSMRLLREEKERKLREIQEHYAAEERRLLKERQENLEEIGRLEAKEEAGIVATYAEQLEQLAGEITQAQERAQAQAGMRKQLEIVRESEAKAAEQKKRSDDLTDRLERLDALKAELLKKLPIPGLEVKNGRFFYEGLPFDRVNTSRQILLAVQIAKLRSRALPLVILDGLERLDKQHQAELEQKAIEAGLQVFATEVDHEAKEPGLQISAVGAGGRS